MGRFENCIITRIDRSENERVDALARMASNPCGKNNVLIEFLDQSSMHETEQVLEMNVLIGWMEPIYEYLKNGALPPDSKQARKLKCKAAEYALMGNILYKRSFNWLCVDKQEANYVIKEVYEGMYKNHQGRHMLAHKIIR